MVMELAFRWQYVAHDVSCAASKQEPFWERAIRVFLPPPKLLAHVCEARACR
jgi:hypothetical protein